MSGCKPSIVVVVAAFVLLVAGCASSGDTSGTGHVAAGAAAGVTDGAGSGSQDTGSGSQDSGSGPSSSSAAQAPSSSPADPSTDTSTESSKTPPATSTTPSASSAPAVSGSTPEPGAYPTDNLVEFQSPSGNIACAIVDDGSATPNVRCDIMEHTFTPPPVPAGGCGATGYGNSIVLSAGAPAQFICAGDTVYDPSAPVLAYDTTSVIGQFSCDSKTDGMVCVDLNSGHWFRIARATYTLA